MKPEGYFKQRVKDALHRWQRFEVAIHCVHILVLEP